MFNPMRLTSPPRGAAFSGMRSPTTAPEREGLLTKAPSLSSASSSPSAATGTSLRRRTRRVIGGGSVDAVPVAPALQQTARAAAAASKGVSGDAIKSALCFETLCDLMLPQNGLDAAILSPFKGQPSLSHAALAHFVDHSFDLSPWGVTVNDRVGVVLPNGPVHALAMICVVSRCCAAPVNVHCTADEIAAELKSVCAKAVLVLDGAQNDHVIAAAQLAGVRHVIRLAENSRTAAAGLFNVIDDRPPSPKKSPFKWAAVGLAPAGLSLSMETNSDAFTGRFDGALVLHTSGTSGTKKCVPYALDQLVVGAVCVVHSWGLTKRDRCLNMMPLFHVGGIVRNLFAPVLSGGSVIACGGFDASTFWHVLESNEVSWYYASPTMHHAILGAEEASRNEVRLRMVANAAGNLTHSLACALRDRFGGCLVLPSYGMTECMPMATPPLNYALEREGTSGVAVGCELRIADLESKTLMKRGSSRRGNIVVRGSPCFSGYDRDDAANAAVFYALQDEEATSANTLYKAALDSSTRPEGLWFDSGDVGYLDADGYLFITGRLKEVINRGGETISPFEIEEAVAAHPAVRDVAAFSVPHAELQEVVGVVIVLREGFEKIHVADMHDFCSSVLHPAKWPQAIVFSNALVKGSTGKVLRANLAKRLELAMLDDQTPLGERHFETTAPPMGAKLTSKIPHSRVHVPPSKMAPPMVKPRNEREKEVLQVWRQLLKSDDLSVEADFFHVGGSSILAGRLVGALRRKFGVNPSVVAVFSHRTVAALASHLDDLLQKQGSPAKAHEAPLLEANKAEKVKMWSSTRLAARVVQALPLFIVFPLVKISTWWLYAELFLHFMMLDLSRFYSLLLALVTCKLMTSVLKPLLGVAIKWLIIGRYRAGRVELWSPAYLRWWFVEKTLAILGRGVYAHHAPLLIWYYKLMGARIGKRCKVVKGCKLREFDLVSIGDDVALDDCLCRGFGVDAGGVVFAPISIGNRCSVGAKSAIAPGAVLQDDTHLGPCSSSHELRDATLANRDLCRATFRQPHILIQLGFGYPVLFLCHVVSMGPWFVNLYCMVHVALGSGWFVEIDTMEGILRWCTTWERVLFHVLGKIILEVFRPFIYLACAILVKKCLIGEFKADDGSHKTCTNSGEFDLFRSWLMAKLLPGGKLAGVPGLIGTHYEGVSRIYRALGAKVGKRVYWPGSGVDVIEFDLLTVGDDVTFASRSLYLPRDGTSAAPINIGAGAMVADRCVLLPGAEVGRNAVLGSGTLAARGSKFAPGSTYVGSRGNAAVCLADGDFATENAPTLRPFGAAFYYNDLKREHSRAVRNGDQETLARLTALGHDPSYKPNYCVLSQTSVALLNMGVAALHTAFFSLSIPAALLLATRVHGFWRVLPFIPGHFRLEKALYDDGEAALFPSDAALFVTLASAFLCVSAILATIALGATVASKWVIMGRRKRGDHPWTTDSYCQRWQLSIACDEIVKAPRLFRVGDLDSGILGLLQGSAYLAAYFRCLGAEIGDDVCLYPTGASPMMTEPDLVSLGDRAVVDFASLVCHLNSRGKFSLNPLVVGAGGTLRAHSRLLSGAAMEKNAMLLEHTLVLSGDVVQAGAQAQGWPAN
ncbi:hypothetical protein M885DRAFT_586307 [Pelagophyceae sp. CCMP2097]|nr:hypothetical protein M885DRAFT_586307 [Pelagophyceae sp. CCMP2097]